MSGTGIVIGLKVRPISGPMGFLFTSYLLVNQVGFALSKRVLAREFGHRWVGGTGLAREVDIGGWLCSLRIGSGKGVRDLWFS